MDVSATTKYVRMSASKARDLARRLRGLAVGEALQVVELSARKGGRNLHKTLKSAIANAENNSDLSVNDLTVKEAVVDEGPVLKRYWPRARGAASPIFKRTCHMRVVLTDGKSEEETA